MKTNPPAVTIEPPILGEPQRPAQGNHLNSGIRPSGTCHLCSPVTRSIASRLPHGGRLHGNPLGEASMPRLIRNGVPIWLPLLSPGARCSSFTQSGIRIRLVTSKCCWGDQLIPPQVVPPE